MRWKRLGRSADGEKLLQAQQVLDMAAAYVFNAYSESGSGCVDWATMHVMRKSPSCLVHELTVRLHVVADNAVRFHTAEDPAHGIQLLLACLSYVFSHQCDALQVSM